MVHPIDKKLLAPARTDSRLQTPEALKHQITSAIERASAVGDRHSLVAVMRAVDPARRDKFCQHLLARFVAVIPTPVPGERVAPRFKEPARFLAAARAEAEAADETEYVRIRGLLDPEWLIDHELAEARAAERAEQAKVRKDRATFSTTFAKTGGRPVVQGGLPSLGKRR